MGEYDDLEVLVIKTTYSSTSVTGTVLMGCLPLEAADCIALVLEGADGPALVLEDADAPPPIRVVLDRTDGPAIALERFAGD